MLIHASEIIKNCTLADIWVAGKSYYFIFLVSFFDFESVINRLNTSGFGC
jgi:hypothetical protein